MKEMLYIRWNTWFKVLPYPWAPFSSRPVTIAPQILSFTYFLPGLRNSSIPVQTVCRAGASCKLTVIILHLICHTHSALRCGVWWDTHTVVPPLSVSYETQSLIQPEDFQHCLWYLPGSRNALRLCWDSPILTEVSFYPHRSPWRWYIQNCWWMASLLPQSMKSHICLSPGVNSSLAI